MLSKPEFNLMIFKLRILCELQEIRSLPRLMLVSDERANYVFYPLTLVVACELIGSHSKAVSDDRR
jgi:hypothetical protein